MRAIATAIMLVGLAVPALAQPRPGPTLTLYLIDVEGGNATLIVSPAGESLLIDTGNGGQAASRDADRIMAAVKDAGVTQIDHLITTHFHTDHIGAMAELLGRIPVRHLIDHGPSVEPRPDLLEFIQKTYPAIYEKIPRTIVKPGDRIAMKGLDVRIPTSAGAAIQQPLPGRGRPIPIARSSRRRRRMPPRTHSRSAPISPSGDSGWSTSATSRSTRSSTSCARRTAWAPSICSWPHIIVRPSPTARCSCMRSRRGSS